MGNLCITMQTLGFFLMSWQARSDEFAWRGGLKAMFRKPLMVKYSD